MTVYEIEILQFSTSDTEYISFQDAARYLHMDFAAVDFYASRGFMKMERIEARWLLKWESVKAFGDTRQYKRRTRYDVKIVRPALPQV